jgi:hypothetical protein
MPSSPDTRLRIDFVNPFIRGLGWDIDNTQGFAERYREVVHEDRVRVAGANRAPDYSFRIGGIRKLCLGSNSTPNAKRPCERRRASYLDAVGQRAFRCVASVEGHLSFEGREGD